MVLTAAKHMNLLTQSQITHYLIDCRKITLKPSGQNSSQLKVFFSEFIETFSVQMKQKALNLKLCLEMGTSTEDYFADWSIYT